MPQHVERAGNVAEALDVGGGIAGQLELEIAAAGLRMDRREVRPAGSAMPTVCRTMIRACGLRAFEVIRDRIVIDIAASAAHRGRRYCPPSPPNTSRPIGAQQRIQDRLVDLRRAESRGQARDAFAGAGLQHGRMTGRVMAERGIERWPLEIELARDHQRAPQLVDGLIGREGRILVEPFRHHQLGGGAETAAAVLGLDLAQTGRAAMRT